jgi:hypothetical protein
MPTRFDIEYARPLCRRRRMERHGQHGVHFTCYTEMRYAGNGNQWWCPACLDEVPGELVAARSVAARALLA